MTPATPLLPPVPPVLPPMPPLLPPVTPPPLVSLRAAARHLGVSVESVRRAIKAKRIVNGLRVDAHGRQCLDLALAAGEWLHNLSEHQLRGRPEWAPPPASAPAPAPVTIDPLAIDVTRFSVSVDGPYVLLAVYPPAPGAEPALYPLLPETAALLAAALSARVQFVPSD